LGGRNPAGYYGHSVTLGLAPGRVIPRSHCRTYRARLRHPVRPLERPYWASLPGPGGLPQVYYHPAAGAGAGSGRLSGGRVLTPAGGWASSSAAFALSRGPPGTPPLTPGHSCRFAGMLRFPSPYGSR